MAAEGACLLEVEAITFVGVDIRVVPVPCLRDNYSYLVFDSRGEGECLVVDPSEAGPVRDELSRRGLRLTGIFNTHHHWDHVGGNREFLEEFDLTVYGHESETTRIPGLSFPLSDGQSFRHAGMDFFVLHVPGHTLGALALCSADRRICFTGDTLFCAGCGRLFEGTPAQMHHSLVTVLGQLPNETLIYCGHEYTEDNLRFALDVSESPAVVRRLEDVSARRAAGEFCGSATLGLERSTNPFLRCHEPDIRTALGETGRDHEVFARLRQRKDRF